MSVLEEITYGLEKYERIVLNYLGNEVDCMRIIRCNKCGTMVTDDENILERVMDEAREERKLAEGEENKANDMIAKGNELISKGNNLVAKGNNLISKAKTRRANAKQLDKLATQIQHRRTQLNDRENLKIHEASVIIQYILNNNLVTEEKLQELQNIAKENADKARIAEERELDLLYKSFSTYTGNRTKADPTYKKGIKGL